LLPKTLVVIHDPPSVDALSQRLAGRGLDLIFCSTVSEAVNLLARETVNAVFSQARLPDGTFREILRLADPRRSHIPVVVCSDFYDKNTYIEAMSLGAFDYIAYPFRRQEVDWILRHARIKMQEFSAPSRRAARRLSPAHASHAA
jgi:DNA-binding NtrC family response regulator